MKVRVLGSGAWQGIPAPFCSCRVCISAIDCPESADARTRPQFYFESGDGSFLLEASPDIRLQSTRWHLPEIRHFLISHYHFDHMRGLAELHTYFKKQPGCIVHCSVHTAEIIQAELGYLPVNMDVVKPFEPFKIFDMTVTPFPVYHERVRDEGKSPEQIDNTFGFHIEHGAQSVVYLADYYRIPDRSIDVVRGATALIADGTYLSTEVFKDEKKHHLHGRAILELTVNLSADTTYFHSVSHLTEKTHDELQQTLPPGHTLTKDGMWILA